MRSPKTSIIYPTELESIFVANLSTSEELLRQASISLDNPKYICDKQAHNDYKILLQMLQDEEPISPTTLASKPGTLNASAYVLKASQVVDEAYGNLSNIRDSLESWVNIIKHGYVYRITNDWVINQGSINEIVSELDKIKYGQNRPITSSQAVDQMINKVEQIEFRIKFPYHNIQTKSGGIDGGHLAIIAARTGVGKTIFLQNIALEVSKTDPVLFVTTEMSPVELAKRFVSHLCGLNVRFTDNILSYPEFHEAIDELARRQLDVIYTTDFTDIMYAMHVKKYSLVCLDYLQMIQPATRFDKDYERVSRVITDAKSKLAVKYDTPVLAAAQFNREGAKSGDRPELWQIRDSGVIEQTADLVISLYQLEDDRKKDQHGYEKLRYDILKSRHGTISYNSKTNDQFLYVEKPTYKIIDNPFN